MSSDDKYKLEDSISILCNSGLCNLDEQKLKEIKVLCKKSDLNIQYCFEILMTHLNKDHSQVRYSAFQIIDCLFRRSHYFRELVLDNFQTIFELVLETNPNANSLPPPAKVAIELKKLAIRTIKDWNDKFSDTYKLLELGFNYLKNCKKIDFVSGSHQTIAQRSHIQKQNEKKKIFQIKKFNECIQEMNENENDIKNCIEQFERCIHLYVERPDNLFTESDLAEKDEDNYERKKYIIETELNETNNGDSDTESDCSDEFIEVKPVLDKIEDNFDEDIELRYLGFLGDKSLENTRNFNLKLHVDLKPNEENNILNEIMRDLYKELKNSHLIKINNWIKSINLVKNNADNLKKAIELKNLVQKILKRFESLNIKIEERKHDENPSSNKISSFIDESQPGTSKSKTCNSDNQEKFDDEENQLDSTEIERKKRKLELLKIAPVIDLNDIEYCAPSTSNGRVEIENPFNKRTNETESETKIQLTKKTFIGKFEPVKWSCRAPLKNGKLCPRHDRFKCPLHGKIVARDETGQIVNEIDRVVLNETIKVKEIAPWQDNALIAEINKAAGKKLIDDYNPKGRKSKKKKLGENLIDTSKETETPRKRLEKRLFNPKNIAKVGKILDTIEHRLNHEKYFHHFSYSIQPNAYE